MVVRVEHRVGEEARLLNPRRFLSSLVLAPVQPWGFRLMRI